MKARTLILFSLFVLASLFHGSPLSAMEESLPPLKDGRAPEDFEALWTGYDPSAEPLETEVLIEWQDGDVIMRVIRYRIGIFKGKKAMMAAVYGFPKGVGKVPALVQIHGGGQSADSNAVLTNARRGYATISIAWAGRINAPGYRVNPAGVQLFWDEKTDDPNYKLTTDWGALDAYHAPCRNPKNAFARVSPQPWTLDPVESPRNNPWFLCTLAARRALTFLEQQPEVDASKLGVYGHSMGGKLTILTAATDSRVKASAPSCGGISDRTTGNPLYAASIADGVNLKQVSCPTLFLSPSNDYNGRIDDLQKAVDEIRSDDWRVTCSPHHSHQDTAEYEVATQLWFDEHLKGNFKFPATPDSSLALKTEKGIPAFSITPDTALPVLSVDIYYTNQGGKDEMGKTIARFWHHTKAVKNGAEWTAELPLVGRDRTLWVYGNITYPLAKPITGAGYYYGTYTSEIFNLSSRMRVATAEQLQAAGVQQMPTPSPLIESFEGEWEKEWFTYKPNEWPRKTHKLHDSRWKAPSRAKLALDVHSENANSLVIGIDQYAAQVDLKGGVEWQALVLSAGDFKDASGKPMSDWTGIKEFRLSASERLVVKIAGKEVVRALGAAWEGSNPKFRNLRWLQP